VRRIPCSSPADSHSPASPASKSSANNTPLLLGCRVVDASTCSRSRARRSTSGTATPSGAIAGNAGTHFLRGVQRTNAHEPYSTHGTSPDTPNAQDAIYRNGGRYGLLALKRTAAGYAGAVTMGVHV
jgi:hypothetical protein